MSQTELCSAFRPDQLPFIADKDKSTVGFMSIYFEAKKKNSNKHKKSSQKKLKLGSFTVYSDSPFLLLKRK